MKKFFVIIAAILFFPQNIFANELFPNFQKSENSVIKYLNDPLLAPMQEQFQATTDKQRNEPLTREEFIFMVVKSAGKHDEVMKNEVFVDVFRDVNAISEKWKYIIYATQKNIVSGYGDGSLQPNKAISRGEAMKIIIGSLGVPLSEKTPIFSDVKPENTLGKYIQTAYENFIVSGKNGKFLPHQTISRGELIKILYNILHSGEAKSNFEPINEPTKNSPKNPEKITNESDIQFMEEGNLSYITVPANSNYKVITAASNKPKSLSDFIAENNGIGGINGAYFDAYKSLTTSSTRIVNGDLETYSKYKDDTGINVIFGFDNNGKPLVVQNMIWWDKKPAKNYNSEKINELKYGIANFPLFLYEGKNTVTDYKNHGQITTRMQWKESKTFICSTKNNDIKMGSVKSAAMTEIPEILKKIDCYNALNLDNGASFGMVFQDKISRLPGRKIMDAFVIVKK